MKQTYFAGLTAAVVMVLSGCTQNEATLANTLANSALGAAGGSSVGNSMVGNMLSSPAAMGGLVQSQVIGAQMAMNPALLGVGALGTAVSRYHEAQNRQAYRKLSAFMGNSDTANAKAQRMLVEAYNKKYKTHYTRYSDIKDAMRVEGYNQKYHTRCKTLTDMRKDFSHRFGISFKDNKTFRTYLLQHKK